MVYSGRGWVALIVFILALSAGLGGADAVMGERNAFQHHAGLQIGAWAVAGAIVFLLGRRWNRVPERDLVARDGQPAIRERAPHTLYRLPMEWWGPILFVLFSALTLKGLAK